MPVQASFIPVDSGAWISLCEQRSTRQSLRIQAMSSGLLVSTSKAGPSITNTFGAMPSGLLQSIELGGGLQEFILSRALDGDLVAQEWFGWLIGSIDPPPVNFGSFNTADNPAIGLGVGSGLPEVVFVAGLVAGPAPVPLVLTSAAFGLIPVASSVTISDGGVDVAILQTWFWFSPGVGDVLSLFAPGNDAFAGLWVSGNGQNPDASGLSTPAAVPVINATTSGTTTRPNDLACGVVAYESTNGVGAFDPTWTPTLLPQTFASPDLSNWTLDLAYQMTPALPSFVFFSYPLPLPTIVGVGRINTFGGNAVSPVSSVVAVYEAFDEVIVKEPVGTFEFVYPKLSSDGLRALRELMGRAQQ